MLRDLENTWPQAGVIKYIFKEGNLLYSDRRACDPSTKSFHTNWSRLSLQILFPSSVFSSQTNTKVTFHPHTVYCRARTCTQLFLKLIWMPLFLTQPFWENAVVKHFYPQITQQTQLFTNVGIKKIVFHDQEWTRSSVLCFEGIYGGTGSQIRDKVLYKAQTCSVIPSAPMLNQEMSWTKWNIPRVSWV